MLAFQDGEVYKADVSNTDDSFTFSSSSSLFISLSLSLLKTGSGLKLTVQQRMTLNSQSSRFYFQVLCWHRHEPPA